MRSCKEYREMPQAFFSAERFSAILRTTSESAYYRYGFCLLVLTILSISAQWAIGPVPLVATANDIMGFIDAGYRVTSGQVPHNDFSTQLGPAFSYIYAIGVGLFGPNISAVVSANLLMMAFTTLLAWLLSSKRLSPFLALIFSATAMTITSGVVPLGWGAYGTDYAMSYNRHGFGILMCICVGSFFPKTRRSSRVVDSSEDILLGMLVSFLLLLKLNFFVAGACALIMSPIFVGLNFKKLALMFVGFLLPIFLFWLVLGVKPQAFLKDMSLLYNVVRETRPPLLESIWKLSTQLIIPLSTVILVILVTGYFSYFYKKEVSHSLVRSFVAIIYLVGADLVLGVSNTQLPILVFLPFISLIALRELLMVDNLKPRTLAALVIFTFLLSILSIVRETAYIAYAFSSKLSADPHDVAMQRIDSPILENVYVPSNVTSYNYPLMVNDGLRLLRKHVSSSDKLVTLCLSNPFNFVLGLKPSTGSSLFWHFGMSYTEAHHLPADQVFSDTDMIIIHVFWFRMPPDYLDYINKRFRVIDKSQNWLLLKKI